MDDILDILKQVIKNPDALNAEIDEYWALLKPVIYHGAKLIADVEKDYANNAEWRHLMAQRDWDYYDERRKVGFTDEQAFTLLLNSQMTNRQTMKDITSSFNANITKKDN